MKISLVLERLANKDLELGEKSATLELWSITDVTELDFAEEDVAQKLYQRLKDELNPKT